MVYNGIHFSQAKGKYISWTEDDVDQLISAKASDKEWVYKRKVNSDDQNENEPEIR